MTVDLSTIACIVQNAARQEIITLMEAHQRFDPEREMYEVGIHYAIRNNLFAHFRRVSPEPIRVEVECGRIENVDFGGYPRRHPVDVAVLHPLVTAQSDDVSGYAWTKGNITALGLIEVKTNRKSKKVLKDVELLNLACVAPPKEGLRKLEWVMLVVTFSGSSKDAVDDIGEETAKLVCPRGLGALTRCKPSEAPYHPGSSGVCQRWFEVMCYGKACSRSV